MTQINSALDLVRIIDPKDLDAIRILFSGNKVDLDQFSQTLRTYIPKYYVETEQLLDHVANAILDLFEELDSDADGKVTWTDFISFYTEASSVQTVQTQEMPKTQTVFNQIQQSTQEISGKTAKVQIESVLANNSSFTDINGTSIINVNFFNENYFITTQLGVYQCDSSFLFPKLIFEPTAKVLQKSQKENQNIKVDNKTREKREKEAKRQLIEMDPKRFSQNSAELNIHEGKAKANESSEEQDPNEIVKSMQQQQINSVQPITCSCVLNPYPWLVVCTENNILVVLSLQGSQGMSEPFRLESTATCLFWNPDEKDVQNSSGKLYVGQENGAVSIYKMAASSKKHKIEMELENQNKLLIQKTSQEILADTINEKLKALGYTTFESEDQKKQVVNKIIDNFDQDDLVKIYPEIKQMLMPKQKQIEILGNQNTQSNQNSTAQVIKDLEENERKKIADIRKITAKDLDIPSLITEKIFNPHFSTLEQHSIKLSTLILQDPKAYIEAKILPDPAKTAIIEKKHGGVQISIKPEIICSKFVANGSIRKIAAGYGHWEDPIGANHFRIAVAGNDGSISIIDEDANIVTCFPNLHKEGIVSIHVVNDIITTVGYDYIFQIPPSAVQQSYLGKVVQVEKEEIHDLETSQSGLSQSKILKQVNKATKEESFAIKKKPKKVKEKIILNDAKLLKGELIKTQAMIHEIPPPRPGRPILATFIIGNIVGVVDFNYMITMFHAATGAHLTRVNLTLPGLIGMKFGECSYNYQKDVGFMPIGKHLFYIKTTPNEVLGNQAELWSFQNMIEQEKTNKVDISKKNMSTLVPIGSVSKVMTDILINQATQECVVITDNHELTFFSLSTGKPVKVVDLAVIAKQLSEETEEDPHKKTEYKAIESDDVSQQYVENYRDVENKNVIQMYDQKKKVIIQEDITGEDLLKKKKERKSSIPAILDPIAALKQKRQPNILDMLGNKIIQLQIDIKGRILYVIGSKGIITVYWKTGCLFDLTAVSNPGKKLMDRQLDTSITNPFPVGEDYSAKQEQHEQNLLLSGTMQAYSLNIDLSRIIKRKSNEPPNANQREQCSAFDQRRGYMFINDSLNPQEVLAITTATSYEYLTAAPNARILIAINCALNQQLDDPLHNFKKDFRSLFLSKSWTDNLNIYKCINYFRPGTDAGFIQRIYNVILDNSYLEKDVEKSFVQGISCGYDVGLVAIATSDARILLFDTTSIKFMKQGVIYLPHTTKAPTITCMQFMGTLPLMFVATSEGNCYIYSIRPVIPSESILLSWKHSNYNPIGIPLNIDAQKQVQDFKKMHCFLLRKLMQNSNETIILDEEETRLIQEICLSNRPELRGEKFFGTGSILYVPTQSTMEDEKVKAAKKMSEKLSNSQVKIVNRSMSALGNSQIESFDRGVIEVNNNLTNSGTSLTNSTLNHQESVTDSKLSNGQEKDTASLKAQENQLHRQEVKHHNYEIFYKLLGKNTNQDTKSSKAEIQKTAKLFKNRPLVIKIRAAMGLIQLASNFFKQCLVQPKMIVFNEKYMDELRKKKEIVEDEDDLLISTNAKISEDIRKNIQISEKTKSIISNFEKSRFNLKQNQQQESEQYDEKLTTKELEEIDLEKMGMMYSLLRDEDGKWKSVKIRKLCTESSKEYVPVTSCCFDQDKNYLILGDEQGFITCYQIGDLIKKTQIKTVEMKKKFVQEQHGVKPTEIIVGFQEQSLKDNIKEKDNDLIFQQCRVSPTFNIKNMIRIKYCFRAHQQAVFRIMQLLSHSKSAILSSGDDKRVMIWNMESCILMGTFQRVGLDPPPPLWEQIFKRDIARGNSIIQHDSNSLQLSDLQPVMTDKMLPVPCRLECPPPAMYPYDYKAEPLYFSKGPIVSSGALSANCSNPLEKTRDIIKQKISVPTFEKDFAKNLLKTTGLTTQLLQKHLHTSWTVRAALKRATGDRLDALDYTQTEILKKLTAKRPQSVIEQEEKEDEEDKQNKEV